jgi:hypothetical protein
MLEHVFHWNAETMISVLATLCHYRYCWQHKLFFDGDVFAYMLAERIVDHNREAYKKVTDRAHCVILDEGVHLSQLKLYISEYIGHYFEWHCYQEAKEAKEATEAKETKEKTPPFGLFELWSSNHTPR